MKIAFLAAANSPHTIKWANAFAENNDVAVISLPEDKDNFGELSEKVSVTYLDVPASQGGFKTVSYTHLDVYKRQEFEYACRQLGLFKFFAHPFVFDDNIGSLHARQVKRLAGCLSLIHISPCQDTV